MDVPKPSVFRSPERPDGGGYHFTWFVDGREYGIGRAWTGEESGMAVLLAIQGCLDGFVDWVNEEMGA